MISTVVNPERRDWDRLIKRKLDDDLVIEQRVKKILARVEENGDKALTELSKEIDDISITNFRVPVENIESAAALLESEVKQAIDNAAENIRKFHAAQLRDDVTVETAPGIRCTQRSVPINRVGLYIPGGSAPLFSTVLMLAIPAKIAGCKEVILCTPAVSSELPLHPAIAYATTICGIDDIYIVGGAQAIAAMAYGTETIRKVDKIFGPGNRYVTTAKQIVSTTHVAIDMPAGPSEVMVLADDTADPAFVASDLLSQAEHGNDSQSVLVASSRSFAEQVKQALSSQITKLPRAAMAQRSLTNSLVVVMDEIDDIVEFANYYAAEHLIISMESPWSIADRITCAGSIFIGNYSPESVGDYASGTNHTLPTSGWARAYSGVNTDSFIKKITIQELTRQGLEDIANTVITMAETEGLTAHANAVRVRLEK